MKEKRIHDNTRVTISVGQLTKLVKESLDNLPPMRESYSDDTKAERQRKWKSLLTSFSADDVAGLLGNSGEFGLSIDDLVAEYDGNNSEADNAMGYLADAARGLPGGATDYYDAFDVSRFDKFLYKVNGAHSITPTEYDRACDLGIQAAVDKGLVSHPIVCVVVQEAAGNGDADSLDWVEAVDALRDEYEVIATGSAANHDQYAVVAVR